jgi:hypothetical protein
MKSKIFLGILILWSLWLNVTPVTLAVAPPLQSAPITAAARTAPIIIDHTTTHLSQIPPYWIEQAKALLRLSYGHTSHGSQIVSGMGVLMADPLNNHLYDFNTNGAVTSGVLSLADYTPSGDLGNPDRTTWATWTRDYLNTLGNNRNVVIWSWCGQVDWASEADINTYLTLMNQLENDFPNVTFVYMTGHLQGTGVAGNLNQRNEQIRNYVKANNKVLFDFADIESYNPDGNYFLNLNANDGCYYDGGNWATEWCSAHPGDALCRPCSECAHSESLNCNLKARAFWWLLARLAGWNGNSGGVDNTAPRIPANPNPADSATNVFFKKNLTWQGGDPDGDPVTYTVAFGPVSSPPQITTVTTPLYAPVMTTQTTYYWQITSTDGISISVGPTWQFTTSAETILNFYLPIILKNSAGRSSSGNAPKVAGCAVFPADNIWNTPIDTLPVDANSAAYVNTIGASANLHADFGSGVLDDGFPIGIPYTDVPGTQAKVNVNFTYADQSDAGPYPIPPNPPIEGDPNNGDGDRHILLVDRDNCTLYELFAAHLETGGWYAGSGAIFNLSSHTLRPEGWTSADAAGLPILPGLARYDEVAAGEIRHALRFTAPQTRKDYTWPAQHFASSLTDSQYPPMGQRFRLKANFNISGYPPQARVILQALKTYGMILADNGSSWYISGAPNAGWDNDVLHLLHQVPGSAFEAVNVSSLMINSNSGQVQP